MQLGCMYSILLRCYNRLGCAMELGSTHGEVRQSLGSHMLSSYLVDPQAVGSEILYTLDYIVLSVYASWCCLDYRGTASVL